VKSGENIVYYYKTDDGNILASQENFNTDSSKEAMF
jgi:hypothetical protein